MAGTRLGLPTRPHRCEWRHEPKKGFSEEMFPSPPAEITGLGVVRPETHAPHGVKRAGFSQNCTSSAQEVVFHGRVL